MSWSSNKQSVLLDACDKHRELYDTQNGGNAASEEFDAYDICVVVVVLRRCCEFNLCHCSNYHVCHNKRALRETQILCGSKFEKLRQADKDTLFVCEKKYCVTSEKSRKRILFILL